MRLWTGTTGWWGPFVNQVMCLAKAGSFRKARRAILSSLPIPAPMAGSCHPVTIAAHRLRKLFWSEGRDQADLFGCDLLQTSYTYGDFSNFFIGKLRCRYYCNSCFQSGIDLILHFSRKLWGRVGRSLIVIFGWALIASYASLVHAGNSTFTTDFNKDFEPGKDTERGNHSGWTKKGTAFQNQPKRGDNPSARQRGERSNHQGEWWIGSFEPYQVSPGVPTCPIPGDVPTGRLQSNEFTIPEGSLTFLVGGGAAFETRVELIVLNEGAEVELRENRAFYASGRNSETMRTGHLATWIATKVSAGIHPYRGRFIQALGPYQCRLFSIQSSAAATVTQ